MKIYVTINIIWSLLLYYVNTENMITSSIQNGIIAKMNLWIKLTLKLICLIILKQWLLYLYDNYDLWASIKYII